GLDSVQPVEFVGQRLARITGAQHDALLQKQDGFLRGSGNLVDPRCPHGYLLFNDVAARRARVPAILVCLCIDDSDYPDLDFRSLDSMLLQKIKNGLAVSFRLGRDGGKIISSLFEAERPNG